MIKRMLALTLLLSLLFALAAFPARAETGEAPEAEESGEVPAPESAPEDREAEPAEPAPAPADMPRSAPAAAPAEQGFSGVIVEYGSVYFNEGETVYNNGGTVFNNGGTVYNNGGTVYNNSGLVYNNGGTVFNNGAEVYNNAGTVIGTGGTVHDTGGEYEDAKLSGLYTVTPGADYSPYAAFEGAQRDSRGNFRLDDSMRLVIRPARGLRIDSATTTVGSCSISSDGSVVLERVDRDGRLTLRFVPDAPEAKPGKGACGKPTEIELRASSAAKVYYTLDGSAPTEESTLYEYPFVIDESCVLRAVAILANGERSAVTEETYVFPAVSTILFTPESEGYKSVKAKPVEVRNTGLATVVINSVRLEGRNADCFSLSSTKGGRVAGGQSVKLWTVEPALGLEAGKYEAEVVLAYASGSESRVKFSFTVVK